jgi:hypothetical protein
MIDDDRLNLFFESQTYTWLKDIFDFNFNGYIKQIEEHKFLFKDDVLGDIWINKRDITFIGYSTKEKRE